MLDTLRTFAALSMAGSVVLSLLPQGGLRRTAAMVVGLLTLLCWLEGLMQLFQWDASALSPVTVLAPTAVSLESAAQEAISQLEALP